MDMWFLGKSKGGDSLQLLVPCSLSYISDELTYKVDYVRDCEYSSDEEEDNEDNGDDIIETI